LKLRLRLFDCSWTLNKSPNNEPNRKLEIKTPFKPARRSALNLKELNSLSNSSSHLNIAKMKEIDIRIIDEKYKGKLIKKTRSKSVLTS
jgi:hypothetical protein